ncbi:MAG: hypothetical protein U5J98_07100 [Halobacteriales archaeon]|nr:hypothetical protein [Halobacteriales archaeon]
MPVPNVEEIEDREIDLLGQLPFEAAHVPDAATDDWDAVLAEPFQSNGKITAYDSLLIEAYTPLELKTCQEWIQDRRLGW